MIKVRRIQKFNVKQGSDISGYIEKVIRDYKEIDEITSTVSTSPSTGITNGGKKYVLWLGSKAAVFAIRENPQTVSIGIIYGDSIREVIDELKKIGINVGVFEEARDDVERVKRQLQTCLISALTQESVEPEEEPEEPESPEPRERRESPERKESTDLPFDIEEENFESIDETGLYRQSKSGKEGGKEEDEESGSQGSISL